MTSLEKSQEEITSLKEALISAQEVISEQAEYIKSITKSSPPEHGLVIFTDQREIPNADSKAKRRVDKTPFAVVNVGGKIQEVEYSPKLEVSPGDTVQIVSSMDGVSIIGKASFDSGIGSYGIVKQRDSAYKAIVVSEGGGESLVFCPPNIEVEKGDKVLLDSSNQVILQNLGKESEDYKIANDVGISWDSVGGLENAKSQLIDAIENPVVHKDIFEFYRQKSCKGVLLYGPPGCGKTLLARACAGSLANTFGASSVDTGYIYVKGPEILSKWVGESEERIRGLFLRANQHKLENGYPAIIFIDEADAVLQVRGKSGTSFMSGTIVPMFLAEMDGLEESSAIVILSTNRPDSLDPAITREGRIDKKIEIGRPGENNAATIFKIYLTGVPVCGEMTSSITTLSKHSARELFSDDYGYYEIKLDDGRKFNITLGDMASGAMVETVVRGAKSNAMARDIKDNTTTGVTLQDIRKAIHTIYVGHRHTNHMEIIGNFVEERASGQQVKEFTKIYVEPTI